MNTDIYFLTGNMFLGMSFFAKDLLGSLLLIFLGFIHLLGFVLTVRINKYK